MELKEYRLIHNPTKDAKDNIEFTLEDYVGQIRFGTHQDQVLSGRALKAKGDIAGYKKVKDNAVFITPTGVIPPNKPKVKENLTPNGLVIIDVDTDLTKEQEHALYNDKYTYVIHRSFGGDGFCIFVRIDPNTIGQAYHAVSKYYKETYDITTDMACSNSNRGRYASFDPDIHINEKAPIFKVKIEKKDKAPTNTAFVFTNSDFDNIMYQIRERGIDLVQGDYYRYIRIGFALYSKFGEIEGETYFKIVNEFNPNQNTDRAHREWKALCHDGGVGIGTFYYYCNEAGINIYSDRTRNIINRVKISKSQGKPTVESVSDNLKDANNITVDDTDRELIKLLISSKEDFSKNANSELTDIEILMNFIFDSYTPVKDVITQTTYINGSKELNDSEVDSIYIDCKKNLDFKVSKSDIESIINSTKIKNFNMLSDFFNENKDLAPNGYIDMYADFITPQSDYNRWAFKHWLVGSVHNWIADFNETVVSPLTLVLTGQDHGIGKTSFFRHILPKTLSKYFVESKISNKDKDSKIRMCRNLIMLDDEFGGNAFSDQKAFKDISDKSIITERLSYGRRDVTMKRRVSLCGTCNELDILKDATGNRRILPINVTGINYDGTKNFDTTSMIIEAYNLLKSGYEWKIYKPEDKQYILDHTSENQQVIPYEEIFFNHFSLVSDLEFNTLVVMNQGELQEYFHKTTVLKPTKYDLKEVYIKNKMEYKAVPINGTNKKGYKLFMRATDHYNGVQVSNCPF